MKFAKAVEDDAAIRGEEAFEQSLPFSETDLLSQLKEFLCVDLQIASVNIVNKSEAQGLGPRAAAATPGNPVAIFSA